MTDLHDRLEQTVEKSGRSLRDISISAGLAPGTLGDILKNRSRSPSVNNIMALARTLGVTVSWLAEGVGDNHPTGFAESDMKGWIPPQRSGQRPDINPNQLTKLLAPHTRSAATMQLSRAAHALDLAVGDIIIVDMNARTNAGDIVVAQVADINTGEASTVLRRYLPPYLVPPDNEGETLMADGVRTSIMGKVVASFRAPQIAGK